VGVLGLRIWLGSPTQLPHLLVEAARFGPVELS
jgi:hypothetical protein